MLPAPNAAAGEAWMSRRMPTVKAKPGHPIPLPKATISNISTSKNRLWDRGDHIHIVQSRADVYQVWLCLLLKKGDIGLQP